MGLLPEEVINASTINGAYSMEISDKIGSITKGKKANLILTHPVESMPTYLILWGKLYFETMINGKCIISYEKINTISFNNYFK